MTSIATYWNDSDCEPLSFRYVAMDFIYGSQSLSFRYVTMDVIYGSRRTGMTVTVSPAPFGRMVTDVLSLICYIHGLPGQPGPWCQFVLGCVRDHVVIASCNVLCAGVRSSSWTTWPNSELCRLVVMFWMLGRFVVALAS